MSTDTKLLWAAAAAIAALAVLAPDILYAFRVFHAGDHGLPLPIR